MKTRRIVWPQAQQVAVEAFELPVMAPDEVLIRTTASVISPGTELAWLTGQPNTSNCFPQYPGYSASATVLEVGSEIVDLMPGDRVVAYHSGHGSHRVLKPSNLFKIQDQRVDMKHAAMMPIAAMSLQGIRKAKIELGESVLVMGLGLLGLYAVALVRLHGGMPVIAVDFDAHRRNLALQLGADLALSPDDTCFDQRVQQCTGKCGTDIIIEVTGSSAAVKQTLQVVLPRGRVVLLGCNRQLTDGMDFYQDVHKPGVSLIGAHNFVRPQYDSSPGFWTLRDDMQTLLGLLASKRLNVEPFIGMQIAPDDAPELYQRLLAGEKNLLGIVIDWQSAGDKQ